MSITLNGTTGITTPDLTVDTDTLVVDEANNRVGIGTSSPAEKLSVNGRVFVSGSGYITNPTGLVLGQYASNDVYIQKPSGAKLSFWDSSTNAQVTIDSSGNLLVGTTSNSPSARFFLVGAAGNSAGFVQVGTDGSFGLGCKNQSGTTVGGIVINSSTTAYNTSSDYRLKENVVGVTGAAARVQQLNPVRFNFIADPDTTVDGFLAHEVQDVVPEAISGTKDAVDAEGNPVYQGIDQSKLVPLLTAALQEALTKIDSLETRIAALEAA